MLQYPTRNSKLRLDILFTQDYGTWSLWKKDASFMPVGFWSTKFSYASKKYSPFENHIWLTYVALRHTEPIPGLQTDQPP